MKSNTFGLSLFVAGGFLIGAKTDSDNSPYKFINYFFISPVLFLSSSTVFLFITANVYLKFMLFWLLAKANKMPNGKFARENGYLDVLPIACNLDYLGVEARSAGLHREQTLAYDGDISDYRMVGNQIKKSEVIVVDEIPRTIICHDTDHCGKKNIKTNL